MNSLMYSLTFCGAVLPLLIILSLYNWVGWNWKTKPVIPLLSGLAILIAAYAAHIYLSNNVANTLKFLDRPPIPLSTDQIHVFTATAQGNQNLAKLLELLTIPLAVSLIAAALFAKADIDLGKKLERYRGHCQELAGFEEKIEVAEQDLIRVLHEGERGKPLLEKTNALRDLRHHARWLREEILDEFRPLIEAAVVPRPSGRTRC